MTEDGVAMGRRRVLAAQDDEVFTVVISQSRLSTVQHCFGTVQVKFTIPHSLITEQGMYIAVNSGGNIPILYVN
jgi:hypothetical protein